MKRKFCIIISFALALATFLGGCASDNTQNGKLQKGATYKWATANKKYENFTDLGNYVIDCDRHQNFDFDKALAYANKRCGDGDISGFGCTALGTKTESGDILIGRNLDLTVSQFPCYVTHVKADKYDTINFTYDQLNKKALKYDEVLNVGKIDEEYFNALPLLASDSMNSEGLYLEYNMRAFEEALACVGTNPEAKIRLCSISLPYVVASHCATVDEALDYMRNSLDIYTMFEEGNVASGWNLCLMIGDATGKYGLIEIAQDEIKFIPDQHGHGNYYIYPAFNVISRDQSGHGRLQLGLDNISDVKTDEDMANLMERIMWRNEILNIPYAYRDEKGHIHFCADKEHKVPSLDWRSDNVKMIPVNENGDYVDVTADTPEAKKVLEYKQCYNNYKNGIDREKNSAGFDKYQEYLERSDLYWCQNDDNFEELQKGLIAYYTESDILDKLEKYYSGDEKPLRDDSNVWTTALSLSVNCTQKRLTVKFWEKSDTVMQYQW